MDLDLDVAGWEIGADTLAADETAALLRELEGGGRVRGEDEVGFGAGQLMNLRNQAGNAMQQYRAALAQQRGMAPRSFAQPSPFSAPSPMAAALPIRQRQPTTGRLYPIGFDSVNDVAANGGSASVVIRPQQPFKLRKLVVGPSLAPDFVIRRILVGVIPQVVANGDMPCEAFLPNAADSVLDCDTCDTSQELTLEVVNISGNARRFRATGYGFTVR